MLHAEILLASALMNGQDGPKIPISSGRTLARHRSGMGSIMEFNDGSPRRVLVLDAKYRANRRFGTYQYDSSLTNYTKNPGTNSYHIYLNSTNMNSSTTTTAAATVTDSWINTYVVKDANTAKQNCDVWMTLNSYNNGSYAYGGGNGVPAVAYCRSILVDGTPCDLPNIQTLARIYCDAEAIDAMDPTITEYPKYALGSRNPQNAWRMGTAGSGSGGNTTNANTNCSWSSTEYSSGDCWNVNYFGYVCNYNKYFEFSASPSWSCDLSSSFKTSCRAP